MDISLLSSDLISSKGCGVEFSTLQLNETVSAVVFNDKIKDLQLVTVHVLELDALKLFPCIIDSAAECLDFSTLAEVGSPPLSARSSRHPSLA